MSIRPADMQIVIHKTQDIHPAKQTVVSKMNNDLLMTQEKSKNDVVQDRQKVLRKDEYDFKRVQNDENARKHKKNAKKKKSDKEDDEEDALEKKNKVIDPVGSKFDMKV